MLTHITLEDSVEPLKTYLDSIDLANLRDFGVFIDDTVKFTCPKTISIYMSEFIDRISELPLSLYKLKRFACITRYPRISLMMIQRLGRFQNPPKVAVASILNVDMLFRYIGNIRHFYCGYYDYKKGPKDYYNGLEAVKEAHISNSKLVDIGVIPFYTHDRWSWDNLKYRPLDTITIAEHIVHGNDTVSLDQFLPNVAYALRVNRDLWNRLYDVCTLLMLARRQLGLNTDCMRLIISELSVSDWDFRERKKRNLTPKRSKWAKDIVEAEDQVRTHEEMVDNRQKRIYELDRAYENYKILRHKAVESLEEERKALEDSKLNLERKLIRKRRKV